VQTFLPLKNFKKSLIVLDSKRLGKQRVEAYQIINVIEGNPRKDGKPYRGWVNHPCTIMWKPYLPALKTYYNLSIQEWENRGFRNNMIIFEVEEEDVVLPDWLGFKPFHSSHRSNLLRKDYKYYSKYGWSENPGDVYLWRDGNNQWYYQKKGQKKRNYILNNEEI
jgi:hypothetical protein